MRRPLAAHTRAVQPRKTRVRAVKKRRPIYRRDRLAIGDAAEGGPRLAAVRHGIQLAKQKRRVRAPQRRARWRCARRRIDQLV